MSGADWALDGVLALALPILAASVLRARQSHRATVLFIALGLVSALAWARLDAPDIALVEAAVGAGLTGALVMSSVRWSERDADAASFTWIGPMARALTLAALITGITGGALALLGLPRATGGMRADVLSMLDRSGASHPVTAVLLNFRGYDTLLEIMVLLIAALAVRALYPSAPAAPRASEPEPLLEALVGALVPVSILVAGYLVWKGAHAPGGAFQAGAILAGGGVLQRFASRAPPPSPDSWAVRVVLLAGPCLFLALALLPLFGGHALLEYPPAWAETQMLAIELLLSLSIGLMLLMLFPAYAPAASDLDLVDPNSIATLDAGSADP